MHVLDIGLVFRIHKEISKLSSKKTNNMVFLNGKKVWTDTSPKKRHFICRWQIAMSKDIR